MGKYTIGLQLLVVGMGTVILTLYLLSLVLRINGYLFGPEKSRKDTIESRQDSESNLTSDLPEANECQEITPEEMMVMAAAVYQIIDKSRYRIISIKRKENSAWKQ